MAKPMTNDQFLKALKDEGCKIHEHTGWRTHNRNGGGRKWGPIHGVTIHHTGSDVQSETYVKNILWNGYSGLPGPLCHVGIGMDGTVHLISNGRANHAGGGDPAVLNAVIAEADWLSTREAKPTKGNTGGVDGNARFYGAEVMYDGGQPMTAAQEDAAVRFAAAICRHYGWSARSVIGHREWSRDKIDPGKENMVTFRKLVQARLDGKAEPVKAKPAKTPTKPSLSAKTIAAAQAKRAKATADLAAANKVLAPVDAALKAAGHKDYAAFQKSMGFTGADADGYAGPTSLAKLFPTYQIKD